MAFLGLVSKKELDEMKSKYDEFSEASKSASMYYGSYKPLFHVGFDGEKNVGELGALTYYHLDYEGLRMRSWESYLASDTTQTIVNKFVLWVVGGGLKLQSEPIESVLKEEGINLDPSFRKKVEARFKLFTASRTSDYSGIQNIDRIAKIVKKNAIIGGDVLVIMRLKNRRPNIQLIDGQHIKTPMFGSHRDDAKGNGNTIKNGIEVNSKGEHVAFHIQEDFKEFKRIKAKGSKTNREMAFIVYGLEYRIDDNRGIPLVSAVLETLKKLDRYKEASVGSAEERAKIPYSIEHEEHSSGENPFLDRLAQAQNVSNSQDIPTDINGTQLADTIAASTNKQVFNLPNGAKLKSIDSKNELSFKEFWDSNRAAICATVGIPPDVAFSSYNSNYSASRAAIKDWEHKLNVDRKDFSFQFYQKIYNFWFDVMVFGQKIQAPGYLNAVASKDVDVIDSYRNARFVGANVPHIDPSKEVDAVRKKLGSLADHIPLITVEAATEELNGGDSFMNIVKFGQELKEIEKAGIKPPEPKEIIPNTNNKKED